MAVHRTMIATESAAEASRSRNDARVARNAISNYGSCDSSSEYAVGPFHFAHRSRVPSLSTPIVKDNYSTWCPCGSRSISSFSKVRNDLNPRADSPLVSGPDDPARQALLSTKHYIIGDATTTDYELGDYHRLAAPRASSGAYLGLLCLAIFWLLPLGIILSGGMAISAPSFIQDFIAVHTSTFEPLTWANMKRAEHCLRFKTRKYMAKSVGNSSGRSGVVECEASLTAIHGVELHPDYCENLGLWSGIWGHWVVDFEEPDCETSWVNFTDEGCQSTTGRRRLTATLDHFNPYDSWLTMCSTTPPQYELNGKKLPLPSKCQRGTDVVIGIWDIQDKDCPSTAALAP